tara:strand:+ start:1842 stop:2216 length:375 start_codon:yes stop_codon:yes gene_type:complete
MKNLKHLNRIILTTFIFFLSMNTYGSNSLYDISDELMCPVCQGQTVAESNSKLAISMREVIKSKLKNGESKEQILSYFVKQYGDNILAKPPLKGFNMLLWLVPPGILLISIFFWVTKIKKKKSS